MGSVLRTGISSGHFAWQSLEEAFQRCRREWDFDTLEIWSEQIGFPPSNETAGELRRLSAEYGVALSYHAPFVGQYDLAQSDAARSGLLLRELCGVCSRIHAEYLVVHLGSNVNKDLGLRCAMSAFSQNAGLIEKHRLKIALEVAPTLWGNQVGDTVAAFERVFRAIDRPWLGLNLDYGHAQLNGNLYEFIDRLGHKINYAHIHDTRGDLNEHLGYGMGVVDWEQALSRTIDAGFRGPFVVEYPESHGLDKIERFLHDLREFATRSAGTP
jgi:sugar phosphate isomerase/epimerase